MWNALTEALGKCLVICHADGKVPNILGNGIAKLIDNCDVVCIEDYDKGVVTQPLVGKVIREAGKKNRKVLVDPARLTDFARYRGADVVTPNRDELSIVTGRRIESLDAVATAAP